MTLPNKLERYAAVNKRPDENQGKISRNRRVWEFELDEIMISGLLQRQITHFEKKAGSVLLLYKVQKI